MPNKIITIQLHSVEYGGDNLGDDIRIDLNVSGVNTTIRGQIDHGTTRTFDKPLSRFQSTNNTVRIASRYQTTTHRRNPIPNGEWDIEIPDYPHDLDKLLNQEVLDKLDTLIDE